VKQARARKGEHLETSSTFKLKGFYIPGKIKAEAKSKRNGVE
jgi:hypothetical protein